MGALIEVTSDGFRLPRAAHTAALASLQALAARQPGTFDEPAGIESALDLPEALSTAGFAHTEDTSGDVVSLAADDKPPATADDWWPLAILEALAPSVTGGTVTVWWVDDENETVHRFARGKLTSRTRKHKTTRAKNAKTKTEVGAPPLTFERPATCEPLPASSFGLAWHVTIAFFEGYPWFRKRRRTASVVEALAATRFWRELEVIVEQEKPVLLVAPPGGAGLPRDAALKILSNGQWGSRVLARSDGEASLTFGVGSHDLELRLHARDAALGRVGASFVDELLAALRAVMHEHRADAWIRGNLAAIGVLPLSWARTPREGYPRRFRHDALLQILDRRAPPKNERAAELASLLAAGAPAEATVREDDDVVTVQFPFDLAKTSTIAAAADHHARWLLPRVDKFPWPTNPVVVPADAITLQRRAPDPAGTYGVDLRLELTWIDDQLWYRDLARWDVILRSLARTAVWSEVVGDGANALARVRDLVRDNDRDSTYLRRKRDDVTHLGLCPNVGSFAIEARLDTAVVKRHGRRIFDDLVTVAVELRNAFRGRASLNYAAATLDGDAWFKLAGMPREWSAPWPNSGAVVQVLDPAILGDGWNGGRLQATRILIDAELPAGATREVRDDGLVVLRFADDPTDVVDAALGLQRHARWLRELRAFTQ